MKILIDKEQILQAMTKDELIWWIRVWSWTSLHHLLWSEVLFKRWDHQSKQNLAEMDRLNEEFKALNLGQLDDLASEMRECKSPNRMKTLIRKANAIRAKYAAHQNRYATNSSEYNRIQILLELSEEARAAEKSLCP
jgi:hypothetical protein